MGAQAGITGRLSLQLPVEIEGAGEVVGGLPLHGGLEHRIEPSLMFVALQGLGVGGRQRGGAGDAGCVLGLHQALDPLPLRSVDEVRQAFAGQQSGEFLVPANGHRRAHVLEVREIGQQIATIEQRVGRRRQAAQQPLRHRLEAVQQRRHAGVDHADHLVAHLGL